MKFATLALMLAAWGAQAQAAETPPVLHIDCSAAAAGVGSLRQPLNSLAQLNAIRFQPGTRILFKRGATCHGSFRPMAGSSGAPGAPIVVDSYGDTALPRPAIAAGCLSSRRDPQQALTEASKQPDGVSPYHTLCTADDGQFNRAALHLFNVEHWEISGLELSNDGLEEAGRLGLLVQLEDFGTGHHYRVNDVLVHHVRGYLKDEPGRALAYKATGGMLFEVTRDNEGRGVRQKKTNFDDVLVENSEIYHVDGIGLSNRSAWMCRPRGAPCGDFPPYKNNPGYLQETAAQAASEFYPSTRLVFRNNKIHDIGGDGIVVRTAVAPLVEANLLYDIWMRSPGNSAGAWAINTDGAVFQYNEVHGVRLRPEIESGDGMAFDADMGTRGTRVYANYSHGNAGGLMLFCACGKDGLGQQAMAEDVVVERNLSVNDKRRAILVAGLDNAIVSGNLIVTNGATPLLESHDKGTRDVLELRGNQFIDTSGTGALYRAFQQSGSHARYAWSGNSFHGYPASAESGAAVPVAQADVPALIEQWFTATQFRQRGYRPR
ncbi:right-handed parallel beta-helix repeat-containing protein [Pseudoduganella aquatica]|uniref:right-handed parallel beta-helix repeat-containing protein n=1 Tax=Pseudoduganella aquatica TaxID=2660641 RepID=UPI001E61638E|nr:right-handed parallel beta-helix repeat-containing protein [Pseudoduganella aquatica]